MGVDAGEEDSMMKWLVWVFNSSIRYVLCVMCDFDKHITMFCVTGIDLVERIPCEWMHLIYAR